MKWCNDLYGGREDKATVGWWRGWKRVEESDIGVAARLERYLERFQDSPQMTQSFGSVEGNLFF